MHTVESFISITVLFLQGNEQSRRDDLESLGYVFYYFLFGGALPWLGMKIKPPANRYAIIGKIKEETDFSSLSKCHPWEFGAYLHYCKNLRFAQTPDYNYLKGWE